MGWGTTFEVAWPVAPNAQPLKRPSSGPTRTWRGSGRALVVDDDGLVRKAVSRQLRFLGFDVVQAADGTQALQMFREASVPFVLVVLDRVMPGISGDQVLTELQRLHPELPIVLMSGYSSEDLKLDNDRVTFLQKPMSLSQLQDAAARVMPPAQETPGAVT